MIFLSQKKTPLHTQERKKANWIGHILCRNCSLQQVTEGKIEGRIEVMARQGG